MTTERPDVPLIADERTMLRAHLDFHRATLAWKCEGLDDEALRGRASSPSALSLLGLVRHMAEVERTWFRRVFARQDVPLVWSPDETGYQAKWGEEVSLRWILVHMIEEYARHNGHADLIRESIDGQTGQ